MAKGACESNDKLSENTVLHITVLICVIREAKLIECRRYQAESCTVSLLFFSVLGHTHICVRYLEESVMSWTSDIRA